MTETLRAYQHEVQYGDKHTLLPQVLPPIHNVFECVVSAQWHTGYLSSVCVALHAGDSRRLLTYTVLFAAMHMCAPRNQDKKWFQGQRLESLSKHAHLSQRGRSIAGHFRGTNANMATKRARICDISKPRRRTIHFHP